MSAGFKPDTAIASFNISKITWRWCCAVSRGKNPAIGWNMWVTFGRSEIRSTQCYLRRVAWYMFDEHSQSLPHLEQFQRQFYWHCLRSRWQQPFYCIPTICGVGDYMPMCCCSTVKQQTAPRAVTAVNTYNCTRDSAVKLRMPTLRLCLTWSVYNSDCRGQRTISIGKKWRTVDTMSKQAVQYVGRTTDFKGKSLWHIVGNLKDFGVGRIVIRHMFQRYKEPCFFKILKVEAQPGEVSQIAFTRLFATYSNRI